MVTNKIRYRKVLEWGKEAEWRDPDGNSPGTFYFAWDLAVDKDSSVYVADGRNDRIQKFDADGNFLMAWDTVQGVTDENIYWPDSITVGYDGYIYVSTVRSEVIKFTTDGQLIWRRGHLAEKTDWLSDPRSLDISPDGILYVHDLNNSRIACFTSEGEFSGIIRPFSSGTGKIVAGPDNRIYIYDCKEAIIHCYDPKSKEFSLWKRFDPENGVRAMAIDEEYNFYIVFGDTLKMYDRQGEAMGVLYKADELKHVMGMDITPDRSVYLICYKNELYVGGPSNKVIKLAPVNYRDNSPISWFTCSRRIG